MPSRSYHFFSRPFVTRSAQKLHIDPTTTPEEFAQQVRNIGKLPQSPGKVTFDIDLNKASFDAATLKFHLDPNADVIEFSQQIFASIRVTKYPGKVMPQDNLDQSSIDAASSTVHLPDTQAPASRYLDLQRFSGNAVLALRKSQQPQQNMPPLDLEDIAMTPGATL